MHLSKDSSGYHKHIYELGPPKGLNFINHDEKLRGEENQFFFSLPKTQGE